MTAALNIYTRGIAANPSEGLYYRRALIYRGKEDFHRALDDMDRALGLSPVDIVISNERLLLLIQMRKTEQAGKELNELNSLGMDARGRIFALCGISLENHDFSQAANLLEIGRKSVPSQVFEQMLKNPVIARHQMRPEIMPFYFGNISP